MQNEFIRTIPMGQEISNKQFAGLLEAVLHKGKPFRFKADGFSMSPFIYGGDIITIVPKTKNISVGEIIVIYNRQERLLVHRIIRISDGMALTKGDNSTENDGWTDLNNVLGVVTTVEHNSKFSRFGLGPEKKAIAWLSQHGYLQVLMYIPKKIFSRD